MRSSADLQVIDPHTHQYMDRMKDEPVFLALASKASDYLGQRDEVRAQARIALRRVEHFYYKTGTVYEAMRRLTIAQQEAQAQAAPGQQVSNTSAVALAEWGGSGWFGSQQADLLGGFATAAAGRTAGVRGMGSGECAG